MAIPFESPVTIPDPSTLAAAGLLDTHTPPVEGTKVEVVPIHKLVLPEMLALGLFDTVIAEDGLLIQPVEDDVKVNVAVPTETPVITPELSILATEELLLTQVPPVEGVIFILVPIQTVLDPESVAMGLAFTVTIGDGKLVHPVDEFVKTKEVLPTPTPVTRPLEATVATSGSLLTQLPPEVGVNVVVVDGQMEVVPDTLTMGLATTVIDEVEALLHPETALVK